MAILVTARGKVSARAVLSARASLTLVANAPTLTLIPTTLQRNSGLNAVVLRGKNTMWSEDTMFQVDATGTQLSGSALRTDGATSGAWAVIVGPGVGPIRISDGVAVAILTITT